VPLALSRGITLQVSFSSRSANRGMKNETILLLYCTFDIYAMVELAAMPIVAEVDIQHSTFDRDRVVLSYICTSDDVAGSSPFDAVGATVDAAAAAAVGTRRATVCPS
jgi:hypothetical protein